MYIYIYIKGRPLDAGLRLGVPAAVVGGAPYIYIYIYIYIYVYIYI